MIIIILSAAWVAGIYIGTKVQLPPLIFLVGLAPLPLLFFANIKRKQIIVAALGILLLAGGAVYAYGDLYRADENRVNFYNESGPAEIIGKVAAMPDERDTGTRLTLDVQEVQSDGAGQTVSGKALVFVPRYPPYAYGDILLVKGEPTTPPVLEGFDYRGYLEHQGIYSTIYYPQIEVLEKSRGSPVLGWIYHLRADMAEILARVLPEPQASLAQGILLGLRGNIPAELNTEFARSGTSHLLAISGYNLAIMAGILLAAGIWIFGRRHYWYVWLALAAIWFYTVITGLNPPVVRGAVMASIFLIAEALGRQRSAAAALVLAAAVMTGVNPYILGDASFQLSFLAMAGLIFIHPVISNFLKNLTVNRLKEGSAGAAPGNAVIDSFSVTFSAIIAVWPVIAYYFGLFSLTGPLATFLLTPVQPVIIILGTLAALTGLGTIAVAQVFGWLSWPFLTYMVAVVQGLGTPAAASVQTGWINPVFLAVYYPALAVLAWLINRRQRQRNAAAGTAGVIRAGISFGFNANGKVWLAVPLFILAGLVTFTAATMPDDKLKVSFLDVGEGDAVLIQKGNTQVLIDGGPSPRAVMEGLSREMPFWDRTIEAVILTHPHQDHLAGLVEVFRRYNVGQVVYPEMEYPSSMYREWQRLIGEKGTKYIDARAGQQVTMGDTVIEVLNPPQPPYRKTESDIDNNSAAVLVREGEMGFLMTGDNMREAEWELLRDRADLGCTVLKAAHHGSDTSSTAEFLAVTKPQAVVISSGEGNKFGHPDEAALARLIETAGAGNVYRTDRQGTIEFTTDGKRLWVKLCKD